MEASFLRSTLKGKLIYCPNDTPNRYIILLVPKVRKGPGRLEVVQECWLYVYRGTVFVWFCRRCRSICFIGIENSRTHFKKKSCFLMTFTRVVQGEKINEIFLFGREGSELRDHCPLLKPGRVIDGLVNSSECPLKKQHFFGDFDWFRLEMCTSRTKTKLWLMLL